MDTQLMFLNCLDKFNREHIFYSFQEYFSSRALYKTESCFASLYHNCKIISYRQSRRTNYCSFHYSLYENCLSKKFDTVEEMVLEI